MRREGRGYEWVRSHMAKSWFRRERIGRGKRRVEKSKDLEGELKSRKKEEE